MSAMAKIPQKSKPWSKKEEELLVRLRAQGLTLRHASNHMRGRGYGACRGHWPKIKDRHPFAIPASKLARMNGESVSSDSSATLEGDHVESSAIGDSHVTLDKDTIPTKRLYARAVLIYEKSVPADRSKRGKVKAPSTDDYDRQAANPTTVGEAFTSGAKGPQISESTSYGILQCLKRSLDAKRAFIAERLIALRA